MSVAPAALERLLPPIDPQPPRLTGDPAVAPRRADIAPGRRARSVVRTLAAVTVSYAVDTVLLGLFAAAGTVSPALPLVYGAAALVICGMFFVLFRTGLNRRLRDPSAAMAQIGAASALQLACIALVPHLAFVFLNVLFIVFAFGALRLTMRQSLMAVLVVSAAAGGVMYGHWDEIRVPHASPSEALLVWLCYATTLARCMYAGLYGSALRVKLHARNLELARSSEKIERLANYDDLTGTINRRLIWGLLEEEHERAAAADQPFCVALLDLDRFKSINDRYGHAVGDAVLQEFAATAAASLRATDLIGRHGGEEFLVLLGAAPIEQATAALERVRRAVEQHDWAGIQPGLTVTVSGGLAAFRPGESATELVSRADASLYEAKRRGRNCLVLAD